MVNDTIVNAKNYSVGNIESKPLLRIQFCYNINKELE